MTFKNEFTWSQSRYNTFEECLRKYYFNYYAYWGGWQKTEPQRTKEIYILKGLRNRYMWGGTRVHDTIKDTIKAIQRGVSTFDEDSIITTAIEQMRNEFKSSKAKQYRFPPKSVAIYEHEYDIFLDDSEWKKSTDNVEQCLKNFYNSDIFAFLKELPKTKWLDVENFSFFYLNGVKVWVIIDCSFRIHEGATIIDWKTGKNINQNVSLQLICYSIYGTEKWELQPDEIKSVEYNLLSNQGVDFFISADEIEDTKLKIRGSIASMQSYLIDVENNIPKEEECFEKTKNELACKNCNFRKVCEDG